MTFDEVVEAAFANGPARFRGLASYARNFVMIGLFVSYFGSCSVVVVVMAENSKQMYKYYTDEEISTRVFMLIWLVPLTLLSLIRNLKFLAPFSMAGNFCIGTALAVTLFYFTQHLPSLEQRPMVIDITAIPTAIVVTIYAGNIIGMIMPLENQMKTPERFVGLFGVLSQGGTIVTFIYLTFGVLGYWCFGSDAKENVALNLPTHEV